MGNKPLSFNIINYEEIQKKNDYCLISTLGENDCLIKNTLSPNEEIEYINHCIEKNRQQKIIIYGKNYTDDSIYIQYKKLKKLGFDLVHLYPGGIFEWLLLQEIYGDELFPANKIEKDILKYKPKKKS